MADGSLSAPSTPTSSGSSHYSSCYYRHSSGRLEIDSKLGPVSLQCFFCCCFLLAFCCFCSTVHSVENRTFAHSKISRERKRTVWHKSPAASRNTKIGLKKLGNERNETEQLIDWCLFMDLDSRLPQSERRAIAPRNTRTPRLHWRRWFALYAGMEWLERAVELERVATAYVLPPL